MIPEWIPYYETGYTRTSCVRELYEFVRRIFCGNLSINIIVILPDKQKKYKSILSNFSHKFFLILTFHRVTTVILPLLFGSFQFDMADDAVIPVDVDFLYKEREAGKRRVKPVAAKYTQLFTNLDNDESDVEFECPDSNSAYTDSSEDGGATTSNDSSEEDVTEVSPETNNKPEAETDEILQMDLNPIIDILKVCSVCLKTDNSDENEIIQCDNCAIQVCIFNF